MISMKSLLSQHSSSRDILLHIHRQKLQLSNSLLINIELFLSLSQRLEGLSVLIIRRLFIYQPAGFTSTTLIECLLENSSPSLSIFIANNFLRVKKKGSPVLRLWGDSPIYSLFCWRLKPQPFYIKIFRLCSNIFLVYTAANFIIFSLVLLYPRRI